MIQDSSHKLPQSLPLILRKTIILGRPLWTSPSQPWTTGLKPLHSLLISGRWLV